MANTKKTNIQAENSVNEGEIKTSPSIKKEVLSDETKIIVKGLIPHVYYTCPKTQDSFVWDEIGDTQIMTYMQLKLMKNQHEGYFKLKWIYPMNDEVIDALKIREYYTLKPEFKDLSLFYENDYGRAKESIEMIDKADYEQWIEKFKNAVIAGNIQNIKIIKLIENKFNIDLISLL